MVLDPRRVRQHSRLTGTRTASGDAGHPAPVYQTLKSTVFDSAVTCGTEMLAPLATFITPTKKEPVSLATLLSSGRLSLTGTIFVRFIGLALAFWISDWPLLVRSTACKLPIAKFSS